jgi:eukaryotic-like serine/threonine-protein kinase
VSDDPGGFESLLDRMVPGAGRPSPERQPTDAATTPALTDRTPVQQVAVHLSPSSSSPGHFAAPDPRDRLGWAALQLALAFLVIYAVHAVTYSAGYLAAARPEFALSRTAPVQDLAALGTITLAVAVFLLARGHRLPAAAAADVGLLFYVAVAAGVSIFEYWEPVPTRYTPLHVSWVCLWITLYPMVVPTRPTRLGIGALAAASMGPLALFVFTAVRDIPLPAPQVLVWLTLPPFVCAALAMYPAPWIHRLETAIKQVRELGSYQLLELIDRGGQGEVWRARHRLLARPAAIKLARPDLLADLPRPQQQAMLQRFEREARITSTLCSPHTVHLFDFGVTEDGSLYAVMELLDGLDLDSLVTKHGPVPPERAVHFLVQACDSLAEAHARRLVHRDIKPQNLMACRYGLEVDFLKVLDFGLVLGLDRSTESARRLTALGAVAGTPAYLAPEIVLGEADIDHRADIYALGCVGFWLLTGRTVFEADSHRTMLMNHLQTDPSFPPLAEKVPAEFERLLLRCLNKDPADRPENAVALRRDLRGLALERSWNRERATAWWATRDAEATADGGSTPTA